MLGVTLPRCAEVQVGGSVVASQRYAGTAAGMREREGKRGEEKRKEKKERKEQARCVRSCGSESVLVGDRTL